MRARWILALGLLMLTAGLTGCIGSEDDVENTGDGDQATFSDEIEATDTQLWHDPQTDSHPAYNYPTFTTIPEDHPNLPEYWSPIESANFSVDNLSMELVGEDPDDVASYGTGIAIFGELVIVPGRSDGSTWVFDIADPENPELVSTFPAPGRDVDTLAFPDGRLFAVFATDGGVVPIWNLTNPEDPSKAAEITPTRGSHNVGIVPGTPLLYNSASSGGGAGSQVPGQGSQGTAIYDLSDPANPEMVLDFQNGYSCHDIAFSIRDDMNEYRAYCAGAEMTQIWNISDPANPEVIVSVPVHHGVPDLPALAASPARFSHLAMASADGDILIVGDETGGGAAPGCAAHNSAGPVTVSDPVGNLYFYDISDEENPVFQGFISPDAPATDTGPENPDAAAGACTAHFGRLIPAEDQNLLAIGFYTKGVNIVDFTNPMNPMIVDQYINGGNVWDVWFYNGYLVTGDITRGMDILSLSGGS